MDAGRTVVALAVAGMALAVVLAFLATAAAEALLGGDADPWSLLPPLAVAAAMAWWWRDAPVAWGFGMAAATLAFLAAATGGMPLVALGVLMGCAAFVATRAPPALRLGGLMPYAVAMALVMGQLGERPGVAPLTGVLLVGLVALYPVAVAWSLGTWLRHVAWAAGLLWCLAAAGVALGDLLLAQDPVAVLGVAFTGALALAMGAGWLLQGPPALGSRGH